MPNYQRRPALGWPGWVDDAVDSVRQVVDDAGRVVSGAVDLSTATVADVGRVISREGRVVWDPVSGFAESALREGLRVHPQVVNELARWRGVGWVLGEFSDQVALLEAQARRAEAEWNRQDWQAYKTYALAYGPMLAAILVPGVGMAIAMAAATAARGLIQGQPLRDIALSVVSAAVPEAAPLCAAYQARDQGCRGMLLAGVVATAPAALRPALLLAQNPREWEAAALSYLPPEAGALVVAARERSVTGAALALGMGRLPPEYALAVALAHDPRGTLTNQVLARMPDGLGALVVAARSGDLAHVATDLALSQVGGDVAPILRLGLACETAAGRASLVAQLAQGAGLVGPLNGAIGQVLSLSRAAQTALDQAMSTSAALASAPRTTNEVRRVLGQRSVWVDQVVSVANPALPGLQAAANAANAAWAVADQAVSQARAAGQGLADLATATAQDLFDQSRREDITMDQSLSELAAQRDQLAQQLAQAEQAAAAQIQQLTAQRDDLAQRLDLAQRMGGEGVQRLAYERDQVAAQLQQAQRDLSQLQEGFAQAQAVAVDRDRLAQRNQLLQDQVQRVSAEAYASPDQTRNEITRRQSEVERLDGFLTAAQSEIEAIRRDLTYAQALAADPQVLPSAASFVRTKAGEMDQDLAVALSLSRELPGCVSEHRRLTGQAAQAFAADPAQVRWSWLVAGWGWWGYLNTYVNGIASRRWVTRARLHHAYQAVAETLAASLRARLSEQSAEISRLSGGIAELIQARDQHAARVAQLEAQAQQLAQARDQHAARVAQLEAQAQRAAARVQQLEAQAQQAAQQLDAARAEAARSEAARAEAMQAAAAASAAAKQAAKKAGPGVWMAGASKAFAPLGRKPVA